MLLDRCSSYRDNPIPVMIGSFIRSSLKVAQPAVSKGTQGTLRQGFTQWKRRQPDKKTELAARAVNYVALQARNKKPLEDRDKEESEIRYDVRCLRNPQRNSCKAKTSA